MSSVTWRYQAGDTGVFALDISLVADDVAGTMVEEDERASWGAFSLWVDGRNLCAHEEQGEQTAGAHWYLLPLLEWLTENWDPLLHEERLPFPDLAADARRAADRANRRTILPNGETDWEEAERVYDWRRRHWLRTAAEGGLYPDIWIRRWRDQIEVTAGAEIDPGTPEHFRFATTGVFRISAPAVADALYEALDAASKQLLKRRPASERIQQLREQIEKLADGEGRYLPRLAWLSGAGDRPEAFGQLWEQVEEVFREADESTRTFGLGSETRGQLVLTDAKMALLFGSASPTLAKDDITGLAELVFEAARQPGRFAGEKLDGDGLAISPGEEGSDLGEEVYWRLVSNRYDSAGWVDIEALLNDLGVSVRHLSLSDTGIRGLSVLSGDTKACVAINDAYRNGTSAAVVRFTLAHELAHLLLDSDHGRELAISSGPWAPQNVEKRANAFAAALLMPRELLVAASANLSDPVSEIAGAAAVAARLRVSIASLADRLYNVGEISRDEADRLKGLSEAESIRRVRRPH